jgi:chromosome segregation ATPase
MALNDEQLHTTTRFTILENHRLTTELEYQSKQTEKLMNRNTQLEEQAAAFKRDIEIHKQVESELAKRSHYCQKIIKKLNSKVKELEDEILNNKKITITAGDDLDIRQDSKMSEELVRFLENKLEESMSRLAQVQMVGFKQEYNVLKADYTEIQQKLKEKSEKYRNLGCLLADYLNDLKNLAPGLNQEDELTLHMHKL